MRTGARSSVGVGTLLLGLLSLVLSTQTHAGSGSVAYSYDDAGRLRAANYDCNASTTYGLDPAGNRTAVQSVTAGAGGILQFAASTYSVTEGNNVTILVSRSCATGVSSVSYTLGGTATQTTDYTISGTLSWAAGDNTAKSLTLTAVDNSVFTGSKTVVLTLSSPTGGATLGTPASTTVTIADNDAVSFSVANMSVDEGAGTATVTVTKSGSTTQSNSVSYATANGSAVAGSDYTSASGTLPFAAADTSKTFTVPITNDTVYEGNETFTVNLSAPTNGATIGTGSATVTILENDTAPSFAIGNATVNENAGTVTLTVTKTGSTVLTHAVSYATADGSATAGSDYTATSNTLTFGSADTSKTFTVAITNDTVYEGNETFAVNLSAPTNGATLGTASATVTITDNDTSPSFSIANVSVNESASTVTLTVTKTGSTQLSHAVSYATADGTAAAGSDYTATSNTLTFANTDTSKTITVPLLGDTIYEGSSEAFAVNLSTPTNGATIATGSATVTIVENDSPPSFSIGNASANENSGSMTFTVTKSGASALTHSIPYSSSDGTANAGSDYAAVSGTLVFGPTDTTQTITVPLLTDSIFEGDETFTVWFSGVTNGGTVGTGTGTGTIHESGTAPAFSIASAGPVTEGSTATFNVTRSGSSAVAQSVSYATSNGTAVAGSDYTATSGTLPFAAGETSKSFTVATTDDSAVESAETFTATLSSPTNGATLGAASATQTINDNDVALPPAPGTPSWSGTTGGTIFNADGSDIPLAWVAGSGGTPTRYELQRSFMNGAFQLLYSGATASYFDFLNLGEFASYQVRACNNTGCSSYSSAVTFFVVSP